MFWIDIRIRTSGWLVLNRSIDFWVQYNAGNVCVAQEILASEEGLRDMYIVG